jgi:allantoin racemase
MKVGVIRVLTTDDPDLLNSHGHALEKEYGFTVISECIPEQQSGVHSDATFHLAVPKIAALASSLGTQVDALIVSCAADPGLNEAIAAVNIPVVGAGSAAATIALTQGKSVGVLDLTPETSIGIADELRERFNIPIVDAVLAAGAVLANHHSQGTNVPAKTNN